MQTLIAFITLIVTIYIPVAIMKFQQYTNLYAQYMSFDFANAFNGVIEFFHDRCNCNVERIPEEYYEKYENDFKNFKDNKIEKENILHFQRRFLNNYFYELYMCKKSSLLLRYKIKKEFTTGEANVLKILIYMNKTCDENPNIYKDLSSVKYENMPKTKGMNSCLKNLYLDLKKTKRWIDV